MAVAIQNPPEYSGYRGMFRFCCLLVPASPGYLPPPPHNQLGFICARCRHNPFVGHPEFLIPPTHPRNLPGQSVSPACRLVPYLQCHAVAAKGRPKAAGHADTQSIRNVSENLGMRAGRGVAVGPPRSHLGSCALDLIARFGLEMRDAGLHWTWSLGPASARAGFLLPRQWQLPPLPLGHLSCVCPLCHYLHLRLPQPSSQTPTA